MAARPGVATQNPWLTRGLDPVAKGARVATYVQTLRRDLLKVAETCGVPHPSLIGPQSIEVVDALTDGRVLEDIYGYDPGWGYPSPADRKRIAEIMEAIEEPEADTEGPLETAEDGSSSDEMEGDLPETGD